MAQTSAQPANPDSPVAVSPPTGALAQLSYSGTPRGPQGYTTPDDYTRDMADPVRRMAIFEEMRAGDHAVNTAIDARRQEINAANWVLTTEDKSDTGTQILEFVEDNVYPVLDDLLRWLGEGGLQYGFGAVEPVFQWADKPVAGSITRGKIRRPARSNMRGIYLAKLAHLRQPSVETFKISETGDLQAVVQYAFNGSTYRRVEIPGDKLLLWTYDQQGDDRWGVPPLRHCVKAWTFKSQLEKLNLLHIDRFGVGLPVVEEGPGWGEADRTRMKAFLRTWRSGGENFLMHPSGGSISIVSDDGKTTMSMLEWAKYYDLAIAKTFLTQSSELGSTQTGARAVGQTMVEQLGSLVQADCEELGSIINEQLIKRLVDWNFGPQEHYPAFSPSARVRANSQLAALAKPLYDIGMLHARPEDEVFVRDALELPAVDVDVLKQEQATRDAAAKAAADAAKAAADAAANNPPPPAGGANEPAPRPMKVAATREHGHVHQLALAEGAPAPAMRGTSYRTPDLTQWESGILKPDVIVRDLDLQTARLAGEVQDVLHEIDANLSQQAEALGAKGAAELAAGVREIAVPDRLRRKLRAVLLDAAERARTYGTKAVYNEIQRQIGPEGIGPQRDSWYPSTMEAPSFYARALAKLRELVAGEEEASPRDLHLEAEVDRAVEEEISRRESSARTGILTALAQAAGAAASVLGGVVAAAAQAALIGLSTGRTQSNVQGVVNVGFGVGRSDAAEAIAAPATGGTGGGSRSGLKDSDGNAVELVAKVYSAVMDLGTCDECAKWDGAEFPIDYPEDYTGVQAPNPRCAGGYSRCRCVWIYITSKESVPLVPAAKGPTPLTREDVEAAIRELTKDTQRQLDEKLTALAQRMTPGAAPQPIALTVLVGGEKKATMTKTITKAADGSFTVTETPGGAA